MISYGDSGSGIVENIGSMKLTVEHDEEPPDDQLYNRERDKKIGKMKTEIFEKVYKEKWFQFCRIYLGLSEEEINYVKESYISPDEMYENIKEFSIKDYQKFRNLLGRRCDEQKSDEAKINSESGSEAEDIYRLIDYVPLRERYNLVCHTLENKEIHHTQLHDGIFPREVMKAMLECYCERENITYDRLQKVKDVAEKNGFLKRKSFKRGFIKITHNATYDRLQQVIDVGQWDCQNCCNEENTILGKLQKLMDNEEGKEESEEAQDEARKNSVSETTDFCRLIDYVPLKDRYEFVRQKLKKKEIHPTQLHDGIFPREVMEAMLESCCEIENTTYDGLLEVKDVAEKKGFLKPKKNAMPDKLQKLVDETEDKEESEEERIEEVFQKEIIKALPGITEFKKFARVSSGLDLDELVIHDTIENYKEDVEKQKFKFLTTWKEKNGKQATNSNTRKLVANYQMGYEELKTNTGTPETSKDNTSTSDQEIFPTSDVIQAKLIYNAVSQKKKKKWQHFAQSQSGMILLEKWGAVGYDLKLQMLRYWRQTKGNTESASVTVVKLTEEFLQKKAKKGIFRNLDFEFVCDVIAKSIKVEDWLKFARVKLELRNEDIKRLRGKYAVLSEEHKYQLMKYIHA